MTEEDGIVDPEGGVIRQYDHVSQVPKHLRKYYAQRYGIFSKFDEGVWLTDDAWFGVTPEPIACKIAQHIAATTPSDRTVLIDAFAGAGGNSIAFARHGKWEQIFAIEKDPHVLKCAKHNAELYGVQNKIWFIEGDCFKVIKERLKHLGKKAVIFASPPWGGPDYTATDVFDLKLMEPYSLADLYQPFKRLAEYVPEGRKVEVIHYCMKAASKALCVFYGDFKFPENEDVDAGVQES